MIKNTTVFLDFSGEISAQNHVIAYAEDLGSRILELNYSKTPLENEHIVVTYHSGETAVFSARIDGSFTLIPNAVMSKAGEYTAYFAVFDQNGTKLTASASVDITVLPCKVLSELSSDDEVQSLYSSLLEEYKTLMVSTDKTYENLKDIAEISTGVNLFDSRLATSKRVDPNTGDTALNNDYLLTYYIPVSKDETLYASCEIDGARVNAPCTWAVYDQNKVFLGSKENSYFARANVSAAKYFRVCVEKQYTHNLQIAKGQYGYEAYRETCDIKEKRIASRHLADGSVTTEKIASGAISQQHISKDLGAMIAPVVVDYKEGNLIVSDCPLVGGDDLNYTVFGMSRQGTNPSPTLMRTIIDADNPSLRISGKNLFDGNRTAKTHNGVTFTPLANGGIKVYGTSAGGSEYELVPVSVNFPSGTYAFSANIFGSGVTYNRNGYNFTSDTVLTFSDGGVLSSLKICVADGVKADAVLFPQLEIGNISPFATPCSVSFVNTSVTLRGLEVDSFDGYTVKLGDKYYICDSVSNRTYNKRIGALTLDGSSLGAKVTSLVTLENGDTAAVVELSSKAQKLLNSCGVMCSHFSTDLSGNSYCFITDDGDFALVYKNGGLASVEGWNAWLKARSVGIRYILKSYTSSNIEPPVLAKTVFPSMSILCSSGMLTVSFRADTKKYIDSRLKEAIGGMTS